MQWNNMAMDTVQQQITEALFVNLIGNSIYSIEVYAHVNYPETKPLGKLEFLKQPLSNKIPWHMNGEH